MKNEANFANFIFCASCISLIGGGQQNNFNLANFHKNFLGGKYAA